MRMKLGMTSSSNDTKDFNTYTLILQTNPGGGRFEGSVMKKEDGSLHHIGSISRINIYGNQSSCIQNSELKKFCYCKKFKTGRKKHSLTG
ncbi:hypothetical protein FHG87_006496 [Trinorchestia longiramus]|nr:hypothetical protein FHG87_006496 [Trinorchestia longiramus]